MKIEAFNGRGSGDFFGSRYLEDLISVGVVRSGNSAMKLGVVARSMDYFQYALKPLYLIC